MTNFNNKPFCIAPWVSVQYGGVLLAGGTTPCCDWAPDAFKGSLTDYFTSDWLNSIKQSMIDHNYEVLNKSCASCIDVERVGGTSIRQRLLEDPTLSIDNGLTIIDYRPDNICNLKCRMCAPNASSLIAKESNVTVDDFNIDGIFEIDYSTVKHVKLVGGEPSISKKTHDLLEWLIENKFNSHIELTVTTNATNANSKWINLITQFKKCYAIISIDAIGPVYEYIRTNANWNFIAKNSEIYASKDIDITFQITGSMYNIPVIDQWIDWFQDKNTYLYPVESHEYLTLAALPDEIRFKNIEFLKNLDGPVADVARQMLLTSSFDKNVWQQFIKYTQHLDSIRKTNLTKISPIFEQIMEYNA